MLIRFFLFVLAINAILFFYIDWHPKDFNVPFGLPPVPWPKDNPYTKEKAELGHILFFDKRLSTDEAISCASCHNHPCGYSDCQTTAIGIHQIIGPRHTPTIINDAYASHYFWDGRASSLEEQCKGPLANTKEMTIEPDVHKAHRECVARVKSIEGYKKLFLKAFSDENITIDMIAQAIATFERTLLSGNSSFDRYQAGDHTALTQEQIKGFEIFKKVGCVLCHSGFNFDDVKFRNTGIGMDVPEPDLGRYTITNEEADWGAFKVPTLREVANRSPYMHDGSLKTLEEVMDYYEKGGIKNKNLSPLIKPLHLSIEEKKALISFLKALSGEGWQAIQEPKEFP